MNPLFRSSLFIILFVSLATSGQVTGDQDRIVELLPFRGEPVKITDIKTKTRVLKAGEKFKGPDDWFKGLTITIKNTSVKPVNYVSALVTFARPREQKEAGRIPFGEPLLYGISPIDLKASPASKPAPSIPPGESIEIGFHEKDFDDFKKTLKSLDFPDAITHIEITLQEVGFEDGLLWSGGEYWRQEPNGQDKFVPVSKEGRGNGQSSVKKDYHSPALDKNKAISFQKINWAATRLPQTPGCNWVSPEMTLFCNDELTCSVKARRSIPPGAEHDTEARDAQSTM